MEERARSNAEHLERSVNDGFAIVREDRFC
jgi:hypothetical protein